MNKYRFGGDGQQLTQKGSKTSCSTVWVYEMLSAVKGADKYRQCTVYTIGDRLYTVTSPPVITYNIWINSTIA